MSDTLEKDVEAVKSALLDFTGNFLHERGTVTHRPIEGTEVIEFTYHPPVSSGNYDDAVRLINRSLYEFPDSKYPMYAIKSTRVEAGSGPGASCVVIEVEKDKLRHLAETSFYVQSGMMKIGQAKENINLKIIKLLEKKIAPERIVAVLNRVNEEWKQWQYNHHPDGERPFVTAKDAINNAMTTGSQKNLDEFEWEVKQSVAVLYGLLASMRGMSSDHVNTIAYWLGQAVKQGKDEGLSVEELWKKETGYQSGKDAGDGGGVSGKFSR